MHRWEWCSILLQRHMHRHSLALPVNPLALLVNSAHKSVLKPARRSEPVSIALGRKKCVSDQGNSRKFLRPCWFPDWSWGHVRPQAHIPRHRNLQRGSAAKVASIKDLKAWQDLPPIVLVTKTNPTKRLGWSCASYRWSNLGAGFSVSRADVIHVVSSCLLQLSLASLAFPSNSLRCSASP